MASYLVSVTHIDKISASSNYQEFNLKCSPSETIESLRLKIHEHLIKSIAEYHIHIAFKGKVLKNDSSTLQSVDMIPNEHRPIPKIYVTMKKLEAKIIIKSRATRQQENEQKSNEEQSAESAEHTVPAPNDIIDIQHQQIIENEEDHKQCRLCFSSEEDNPALGQLFQPCRYVSSIDVSIYT